MSLSVQQTIDYARKILIDKTSYVQLEVTVRNMVLDSLSSTHKEIYSYLLEKSPCTSNEISEKLNKSSSHICNILNKLIFWGLVISVIDKKSGNKLYFHQDL